MIIVTGVDASGTSAIVRALIDIGIVFPKPYTFDPSFENVEARTINDMIMLDLTGSKWGRFPSYKKLVQYKTDIVKDFPNINWKDPRACVTLPVWRDKNPRVIWVKRSPYDIASSWLKRKKLYPRPGYNSRRTIYDYIVRMEGFLFLTLGRYEIPWHVAVYEDWYKDRDIARIRQTIHFCGTNRRDPIIRRMLDNMHQPENRG